MSATLLLCMIAWQSSSPVNPTASQKERTFQYSLFSDLHSFGSSFLRIFAFSDRLHPLPILFWGKEDLFILQLSELLFPWLSHQFEFPTLNFEFSEVHTFCSSPCDRDKLHDIHTTNVHLFKIFSCALLAL